MAGGGRYANDEGDGSAAFHVLRRFKNRIRRGAELSENIVDVLHNLCGGFVVGHGVVGASRSE
jgi:hypothetical protein